MKLKFFNVRAKVYTNKTTGQISLTLPKKKMKKFLDKGTVPKEMKISLWRKN